MKTKSKFILLIVIASIVGIIIKLSFNMESSYNKRSDASLINQYFQLRDKNPQGAKRALERLLEKNPKNLQALRELGYWYLRSGDIESALKIFTLAKQYYPNDQVTMLELAKLGHFTEPKSITPIALQISSISKIPIENISIKNISKKNQKIIKISKKNKIIKSNKLAKKNKPHQISERDKLFNQYYELKRNKKNSHLAFLQLLVILKKYPNDLMALKEAGYTMLNNKNNAGAYFYFKRAYNLTHDPKLAMQIGYILDGMGSKRYAYDYFNLATKTIDKKMKVDAELAKTNLTFAKIKAFPDPYYMDIYYDPFYYSRFNMTVEPLVIKAGKVINQKHQTKIYLSYQRTSDTRSNFSQLPQIFGDNAAITALGIQTNPLQDAPLTAFAEVGKAFDIVYQNRSRIRTDFRSGLAFYKDWGERPTYTLEPVLGHEIVGDFYSDMIYFTRYRDIIGSARLREGIRVFKYETTMIDLYLKGFLVWDTNHQYYNNIIEWGPGIAITPSNRYNIVLHLEALQGHYIPVTSPSPNPYASNYHNNLILLNVFFRL